MERREFITGVAATAGAAGLPRRAAAAQPTMLRVGTVSPQSRARSFLGAGFERRMSELGYVEGRNFTFDYHCCPN
jgi:hypothetical protein